MRQFRSPGLPRLAPALFAGVVAASFLALGAAPAGAADAPTSCVLSLTNLANPADPELGKLAAQRLALALEKTGARAIVPAGRVQETLTELDLAADPDKAARLQLAAKVEASEVIYGTLFSTRFTRLPKMQGRVRMMVMIEVPGTAQIQALSVEGSGPIHKQAVDQTTLLHEALDNAGAQIAAKLAPGISVAAAPVRLAASGGGIPAPLLPLVQPTAVVAIPLVTVQDITPANGVALPAAQPVVVDAAGIDRDLELTGLRKKKLITTKTVRTLVGGVLLLALLGLAGGGPLGALGP